MKKIQDQQYNTRNIYKMNDTFQNVLAQVDQSEGTAEVLLANQPRENSVENPNLKTAHDGAGISIVNDNCAQY